jgi:NTE family protein
MNNLIDNNIINYKEIDTLCISGGGIQGFSFISALDILVKHDYINLNKIKKYVGTSFGSILGFLLTINYTPEELIVYYKNFDLDNISVDFDLELFLSDYGFNNGDKYIELIKTLFFLKLRIKEINFKDLEILTKKKLIIIGTNLTECKEEIFSSDTTPEFSVITAIRISIGIPLVLTPIKINDSYYFDGCIMNNLAFNLCDPNRTLCILFNYPKKLEFKNLFELLNNILTLLLKKYDNAFINYKKLIISCKNNSCYINGDCNFFDNAIKCGIKAGLKFLKKEFTNLINNKNLIKSINKENIHIIKDTHIDITKDISMDDIREEIKKCIDNIIFKICL